jgi:hypothetical protein
MKKQLAVAVLAALVVLAGIVPRASTPTAHAATWAAVRAYKVDVAFSLNGEPHYGAFFPGSNCTSYRYLGDGGGPPTPDWWGPTYSVALLSKTWLYSFNPGGYHWNPNNHEAICKIAG